MNISYPAECLRIDEGQAVASIGDLVTGEDRYTGRHRTPEGKPVTCTTHLAQSEKFRLWGRLITRIKYNPNGDDSQLVSLYAWNGFVGSVQPSQCVEVMNILGTRGK